MASSAASHKKRRTIPPPQPGQQLISSFFLPKNVSEVRGKENAPETSSGESSQTASEASSIVAVATIAKPTSASGTRKNNGVSSRKNSSKQAKKQPECLDRFSQLPEEILQNIFCQLPIADLRSCALVCPQWRSVISNDLFIPWKKKYFHHKNGDGSSQEEMMKLLNEKGLLELDSFPINLASFMKDFRSNRHLSALEQQYLERHHNFSCIEQFLQTPTCESKEGTSLWSVVALLIWSSQTDYEVHRLMNYMSRCTPCLVYDILEFLYCLASIFCCLESRDLTDTSTRLYYRVLCSLYLYENACLPKCASENDSAATRKQSQSRTQGPQLPVTYEQARIVIQEVKSEELMKIVAFAGTGKTTTLVEYTRKRPKKKFLNVAYNKSIQQHAVKTFPSNVESRTMHSLAYKSVGKLYQHKLTFNLRINCIMDALQGDFGYLHARRVSDTLNNFIASADATVKLEHVPEVNREVVENLLSEDSSDDTRAILGNQDPNTEYLNSAKCKKRVVSHTEGLWERMKNKTDNEFKITHDGYLKIFQLSKPILEGYDYILVDEAQDCTPAASDILLRQSCAKILVGDPHQQIYAFRGARNALQEVTSTHTFYLTQSFRFGPGIANVASRLLNNLKGVQDKRLVGVANTGTGQDENFEQQCVITRCNSTLFDEAANVCCQNNNTKVGFVGGKKGLALDRVLDIHKLYNNAPSSDIKDPFIKKFNSFAELKKYAKAAPDIEMLSKIKIVETHQGSLEHKIEMIKSKAVENYKKGDVIYTTAHKAKGLEFDKVRLTDDFLPGIRKGEDEEREDEKNLAYVAVTRAKKRLELSDTIQKIVTRASFINQNRASSLETSS